MRDYSKEQRELLRSTIDAVKANGGHAQKVSSGHTYMWATDQGELDASAVSDLMQNGYLKVDRTVLFIVGTPDWYAPTPSLFGV